MSLTVHPDLKEQWAKHKKRWIDCKDCYLHTRANQHVLARGDIPADVLFIGEAPGMSEDAIGEPFVGPAGRLLDTLLASSFSPEHSYCITNLVACLPTTHKANGLTATQEPAIRCQHACYPRLVELQSFVSPRIIVAIGSTASRFLSGQGVSYWQITHPAFLLRNQSKRGYLDIRDQLVNISRVVDRLKMIEEDELTPPPRPPKG